MNFRNGWIIGEGYPFIIPLVFLVTTLIFAGSFLLAFFFLILTGFVICFFS